MRRSTILLLACLAVALLATRLAHARILWSDEDYHLAAAIQALFGKVPYRDLWYDKPPLNIAAYLLFGAKGGWILRVVSALFATGLCGLALRFAGALWTGLEAAGAALLTAFFLIFYFPGPTITLEPDTLMIAPHLAAVYLAWKRRAFAAGAMAAIAFGFNVKGLFVLAACAIFSLSALPMLAAGFVAVSSIVLGGLALVGALPGYWQQVWQWGFVYAGSPDPLSAGLMRAVNWTGFHAALVIGCAAFFLKDEGEDRRPNQERWKFAAWLLLSLAGAGIGGRFLPRYLNGILPPLLLVSARGLSMIVRERRSSVRSWAMVAVIVSFLVPAVRFGPRYARLAADAIAGVERPWQDTAMDRDSKDAARVIQENAKSGDTIFIWGYRPNIVVYAGMPVASRFWDSQALTAVPADRHLTGSVAVAPELAAASRRELARTAPAFVADGLSFFNPKLAITEYADLREWFANYCAVGKTGMTTIYRRCER